MNPDPNTSLRSIPIAEARALLEEQGESDLSIAAFARTKGVKPWALYNARASERRRSVKQAERFAEVRLLDEPPAPAETRGAVELALPSGVVLRVQRDFDEVALRRLIGVLGSC